MRNKRSTGLEPSSNSLEEGEPTTRRLHTISHAQFGTKTLWEHLIPKSQSSQSLNVHVQGWFMSTMVLPTFVNKADSLWESKGLRDNFVDFLKGVLVLRDFDAGQFLLLREFVAFKAKATRSLNQAVHHAQQNYKSKEYFQDVLHVFTLYSSKLAIFDPAPTIAAHLSQAWTRQYDEALLG